MEDPIPITVERLRNCGWEAAVVDEPESYHAHAFAFRKEANAADAAGDAPHARMLEVLALICSLVFEPTNRGQPFQPFMVTKEGRTFMPDDLDASELAALVEFGVEITNGLLQARLADLGWLYLRPRSQTHALRAIDAYTSTSIDEKSWFGTGARNWKRAVVLCVEVKKAAREKLVSIEKRLLEAVLEDQSVSAPLRCSIVELLRETRLAKTAQQTIAERLEQDGLDYVANGDPLNAREPLKEAALWYHNASLHGAVARVNSEVAKAIIAEGQLFEANATNGALAATSFFRDALEHLQRIPGKYRQSLRVDERIRELRQRITECNERGLEGMQSYESDPFDIARFVTDAQAFVTGKSAVDALVAFIHLVPIVPTNRWREKAAELAREHPLGTLFPGFQLSDDGRITSTSPGVDPREPDSPEWRDLIEQRAVGDLARHMLISVKAGILPALEALHSEHRLTERDFIVIVSHSPMVPDNRAVTVGRGLHAGFNLRDPLILRLSN